jgi:hypothetical protein
MGFVRETLQINSSLPSINREGRDSLPLSTLLWERACRCGGTMATMSELKERADRLKRDKTRKEEHTQIKQLIAEKKKALILGVVKPDLLGVF